MISLQVLDSILTTQMSSGQLLNDSAAGNTINHLQLTFISSPLYTSAQLVPFTVTAHSRVPFSTFFSCTCLMHTTDSSLKHLCQVHSCENNHFTFILQLPWNNCVGSVHVPVYAETKEHMGKMHSLNVVEGLERKPLDWQDRLLFCQAKVRLHLSHRDRDVR